MEQVERAEQRPGLVAVENQTNSQTSRVTVDGRTITYRMQVLQQPVRARACGQGAKSSADRRPVDPPPIVELRIFEGENAEKDITFTMHANYFLFATLEHARTMAHGRLPQDRNMPPVLTGTPVAGLVYLDRPDPAGYFIFPDLSVRHEGKYRLSFSLHESLKDPNDDDKPVEGQSKDDEVESSVTHRLEVKSEPFMVYSAKKFPGLTESTALSRTVAEQGCRVRIRRDVRMRRREHKSGGKDWDEYEEDTAQARSRMSATPDPGMYGSIMTLPGCVEPVARARSPSTASHQSNLSRRPSLQDLKPTYPPPPFGSAAHTPQHSGSFAQTAPMTQQAMQPPMFAPQAYPAPPPPPMVAGPAPPQQGQYGPPSQYPLSRAYEPSHSGHRSSIDYQTPSKAESRRPSVQYSGAASSPSFQPQTYPAPSQASVDQYHHRPTPLEPGLPSGHGAQSAMPHRSSFDLPPLNTTIVSANKLEASSPVTAATSSTMYGSTRSTESHKRSYGHVFSDRHQSQPLRQGARPSTSHHESSNSGPLLSAADDDDDSEDANDTFELNMAAMRYRRADGRQIMRALPPQV